MNRYLRPALAVVLGFVVGSAINMGLIVMGGSLIAPPPGADVATMEGLKASLPFFEPRHFLFPFLGHAVGTLAGALVATWVVQGRTAVPAYVVGALFLMGGVANVVMLPGPMWFNVVDVMLAYLPAAWLGDLLARWLRRPDLGE